MTTTVNKVLRYKVHIAGVMVEDTFDMEKANARVRKAKSMGLEPVVTAEPVDSPNGPKVVK